MILTNDPSLVYVTKGNITYPGTAAQATAAEARAKAVFDVAYAPVVSTIAGGSIKVAS